MNLRATKDPITDPPIFVFIVQMESPILTLEVMK